MSIGTPPTDQHPRSPESHGVAPSSVYKLGICCRDKKQKSQPMQEFLNRIRASGNFDITCFPENMIQDAPVDDWPKVDCCIPFFSAGFPLDKAIEYAKNNHDTFFLTEPREQQVLLDRRSVYHALVRNNIPVVRHVVCSRDGYNNAPEPEVVEEAEYVVINGQRIDKPFVEKPVDSEDHNIRIYYANNGGSRHLFRKVGDKSSEFHPECNAIRREGSYIYEDFVETKSAQDVKVYTVGLDYAHAECRKSPVVDGTVQRDENGKEIRETTPLTEYERQIARKIVKVFRQRVCGFDLLRTNGGSYVCDVNGWSFVKGNKSYYDNASAIICDIFLDEMRKRGLMRVTCNRPGKRELKGIIALFRHGDRTPKQKIKLKTKLPEVIQHAFGAKPCNECKELVVKGTDQPSDALKEWKVLLVGLTKREDLKPDEHEKYCGMVEILDREAEGLKLQVKPQAGGSGAVTEAQVILKWGGWLTDAGRKQARNLGMQFNSRVLRGKETQYQLDVFANNERRVRGTAVEFAMNCSEDWDEDRLNPGERGLEISASLDDTEKAKADIQKCKDLIAEIMHLDNQEACEKWKHLPGLEAILQLKGTPKRAMQDCHTLIKELIKHIPEQTSLHRGESSTLVKHRWSKLSEGFFSKKTGLYDTSKISDVFDYISYDVSYNQEALFPLDLYPLFEIAQVLNLFVGVGEYGLTPESRGTIGAKIITPLLKQWRTDLQELQFTEEPRTRLYFSSESHITSLYNVLYNCSRTQFHVVNDPVELHYLSHVVIKVYKYNDMDPGAIGRYQMEVLFSTGIDTNAFGIVQDHHVMSLTPMIRIHNNLYYHEFEQLVTESIKLGEADLNASD
eukprot:TRINITY_DN6533_c0_g2_i1.p1 TRINITY_DN6533_c0_g2~~TRINITY_DN6533_c0_g2_i1.p1  ORF type:complete len:847 (+),score=377.97 TRINITY_DN6533_c0_g2_i1:43-2583(+)